MSSGSLHNLCARPDGLPDSDGAEGQLRETEASHSPQLVEGGSHNESQGPTWGLLSFPVTGTEQELKDTLTHE